MGRVRAFFEYKIHPEYRQEYLLWVLEFRQLMREAGFGDIEVLESNQRPNQFIETFTVDSMDRYELIAVNLKSQTDHQELQARLDRMLQGGRETMKIWFFTEI